MKQFKNFLVIFFVLSVCAQSVLAEQGCDGDVNAVNTTYTPGCVRTCDNYKDNITCRSFAVVKGCQCKEGFIHDTIQKKCVRESDCRPGCRGDVNAKYYECGWCPQSCENLDDPIFCTANCRQGDCGCKPNYVLNTSGKCVRPKECHPKQCRHGEKWDCPKICGRVRCHEIGVRLYKCPVQTQEEIDFCVPECVCKDDFLRDNHGRCIPADKCPVIGCNGDVNAVEVKCPTPCPLTCSNYMNPQRVCSKLCIAQGCQCKENFVLDTITNRCVSTRQCPVGCGGDPNASSKTYSPSCVRTCDNYREANFACNNNTSEVGCVCNEGFVLNTLIGKCVTTNKCPKGCGGDENAVLLPCGNVCPRTCARPVVTICPELCKLGGGCGCGTGFVEAPNGKCILQAECPVSGCNGDVNAVEVKCPNPCPLTCSNYMNPPKVCSRECIAQGCQCKENFVLDTVANRCVTTRQCPVGCGGDPNASSKTYSPSCVRTCDNYREANFACNNNTSVVGCVCNEGFVLDTLIGKCITTNKCPKGCGGDGNAVFLPCGNVCPRTCARPVVTICPELCKLGGGCGCGTGYVQGSNGSCILPTECPASNPSIVAATEA